MAPDPASSPSAADDPEARPVGPSLLAHAGRFLGAIGGSLGVAAGLAVLFGPAPAMGILVPSPVPDRPAAVVEAVAADPLTGVVVLAWPVGTALVGAYGGVAALRRRRRRVLGAGVLLVFLVVLGPPAMIAALPAAVSLLGAWALLAGDRVVRARRAARLRREDANPP